MKAARQQLSREYKINRVMEQYQQLRANPEEWASYQLELAQSDNTAGDGLPSAFEEYPEFQK